ncbi:MAG: DNA polymerase III subunit gamma/tau [Deltaproteobacteria bacterium]|nr:DNA polymerase III subunit gamma/tau [Deltaproteobacteria bacterium]MBW2445979.1 DNA polymerase III subunit gamma/tau [Deltaproteobacteria bacterium]
MSYQVLARKWRPQTFDDVCGQDHVTGALRNAIAMDRVHHAILLCGPRGTGKTTLARILARGLNCDKGPTDQPCGACPSCTEIAAGNSTDVQEIDAASRTSVDDVREVIESIRYAASPGKHRIFIVDEVHMLSKPAFNALLKTLEEPPPRSLFVFATTDPEKIPFTVVSRCQRFDLRRISTPVIQGRLKELAGSEGIEISDTSLLAIAREGDGSLRDALTLFDQIIASGGTEVDDDRVAEVLDLIDRRLLLAIVEACVDSDPAAALVAAGRAAEAGIDARRLAGALLETFRDLVVLRTAPDAPELVEGSDSERAELQALADRTDAMRLRRMFRAMVVEQEDLAWAPEPFAVVEMTLVRLATLAPGDDVARLLTRLESMEQRLSAAPGGGSAPSGGGGGGGSRPQRARSAPARAEAPEAPLRTEPNDAPVRAKAPSPPEPSEPTAEPAPTPAVTPAPANETEAPLPVVFDRLRAMAQEENRGLYAVLDEGRLLERTESKLRIALPEGFGARRLETRLVDFEAVCQRLFGRPIRVELAAGDTPAPGPKAKPVGPPPDSDLARRRRADALKHPGINEALDVLGGEILDIRPLNNRGAPGDGV